MTSYTGTASADTLQGTVGDDVFTGGGGNDSIWGRGGADTAQYAGKLGDYAFLLNVDGTYRIADLRPGSPDGVDTLRDISFISFAGGVKMSLADAYAASPRYVEGTPGAESQLGGNGNDAFLATGGNDHVWGGNGGFDRITYRGASTDYAYAANSDGSITLFDMRSGSPDGMDKLRGIDRFDFTNTSLSALQIAATLPRFSAGTAGADSQMGTSGNDVFRATAGNDQIWGGSGGTDMLVLTGNVKDYIFTRNSSGSITISDLRAAGSEGKDTVRDIDSFRFADATLTEWQVRNIASSAQANVISGTGQADVLLGTANDDVLTGGAGQDRVWGGKGGNDTAMYSGNFSDYIITDNDNGSLTILDRRAGSPDGTDVVRDVEVFRFADRAVSVQTILSAQTTYGQVITGSANGDTVTAAFLKDLFGAHTNDIMVGNGNADELRAGPGNDLLIGDDANGIVASNTLDAIGVRQTVGPQTAPPGLAGFSVTADTTATVKFMGETAGFLNSLGFYKISSNGAISDVKMLFPNASLTGSGGSLTAGVSAATFDLKAGDQIGFFIIPNGAGQTTSALLASAGTTWQMVYADGTPANVFGGREVFLASIGADGKQTIIKSNYGNSIFHSIDTLGSSGLNGDRFTHVTNAMQMTDGSYKMGFEDLWGGGDKDYDDTVFQLSVDKPAAELAVRPLGQAPGAAGGDILYGGAGADTLLGQGGDDRLNGGTGADILRGGTGFDTADYSHATAAVTVDLTLGGKAGEALGDSYFEIEQVVGSAYADTIIGGTAADVLDGRSGADTLRGMDGNDTLRGGGGADLLDGGAGFDTATYYTSTAGVTLDLAAGTGSGGDASGDRLIGIERVQGSNTGNDTIYGSMNFDLIESYGGADRIDGRGGNDYLNGGAGDDVLTGGQGNDTLNGSSGIDVACFTGKASDYTIVLNADGSHTVTNHAGGDGSDILVGIETLRFSDGDVSIL